MYLGKDLPELKKKRHLKTQPVIKLPFSNNPAKTCYNYKNMRPACSALIRAKLTHMSQIETRASPSKLLSIPLEQSAPFLSESFCQVKFLAMAGRSDGVIQ